jgi:hypothetical protein
MNNDEREVQAKQRFILLSAMRFGAVILVMLGIANIGGRLFQEFTPWLGYGFLLIGALDFFLVPIILKKSWARQDSGKS